MTFLEFLQREYEEGSCTVDINTLLINALATLIKSYGDELSMEAMEASSLLQLFDDEISQKD